MLLLQDLIGKTKQEQAFLILKEQAKCRKDARYTLESYFSVTEPTRGERVPFILYPHQIDAIEAFQTKRYNITMKTRQMGLTTISAAYVAWYLSTKQNQVVVALANKLKTSRRFLKEVRRFLDEARKKAPWLIPDYEKGNNGKDSFSLKTGSTITAESNNDNACRGEVINLLIIDEVAAIDQHRKGAMEEIWSSAGITLTRSKGYCIAISTPKGQSGWYYEQYTDAQKKGWNVIDAHWSVHPIYSQGMYQWIKDEKHSEGGYIKRFNDNWPDVSDLVDLEMYKTPETYNFICDGKLRSPWYDNEANRLGIQRTRCELDCSFAGSGSEVLDPETIREYTNLTKKYTNKFIGNGPWKSYHEFISPKDGHTYLIVCDVATGDGSDYSTIIVLDITDLNKIIIVATYKDQIQPTTFAKIIYQIAKKYYEPLVIVEHQVGITTLLELKERCNYKNIYYSTLKQKNPTLEDKNAKKTKIGFWQSEETRTLGGDKLEEWLNSIKFGIDSSRFKLIIPDIRIVNELQTWIWTKGTGSSIGRRDHAPGRNDDLIMALTMAAYYITYVLQFQERRKSMSGLTNRGIIRSSVGFSRNTSILNKEMFDGLLE